MKIEVLWVELKQILHLKVGCSDFGPVWDEGSLPYLGVDGPGLTEAHSGNLESLAY